MLIFQATSRNFSQCNSLGVVGFLIGKPGSHLGKALDNISQMRNCDRAPSQAGATVHRTSCRKPPQKKTKNLLNSKKLDFIRLLIKTVVNRVTRKNSLEIMLIHNCPPDHCSFAGRHLLQCLVSICTISSGFTADSAVFSGPWEVSLSIMSKTWLWVFPMFLSAVSLSHCLFMNPFL